MGTKQKGKMIHEKVTRGIKPAPIVRPGNKSSSVKKPTTSHSVKKAPG